MNHSSLFEPTTLGRYTLKNRIVLPPLTRQRSGQPGDVPTALMAAYYRQRASAGFMVSEGAQIEPRGQGYSWTPGIYSEAQIEGWRKVTDAVHAEGGIIFAQLWHVGRVSHTALQPGGAAPVAPSAIQAEKVKAFIETARGVGTLVAPSMPRELSAAEVQELVALYAQAARNAVSAGFDGVEIHAANGYLVNQFISAHANRRTDDYGGSLPNRLRFLREIVQAVSAVVGPDRLGVRFLAQQSGHIINLSSVAGIKVFAPGGTVSSGTRFAVRAISEGLRQEVGETVRVTSIEPGAVESELKHGTSGTAKDTVLGFYEHAIPSASVARAIAFAIEQPDDVDVNEIVIRPTKQEF